VKNSRKDAMMIGWSKIDFWGKNRILTTSFLWVVVVPLCANFFDGVNSIKVKAWDEVYSLNFVVPFSWHLFYFAALAIAIGKVIYTVFCPEMIARYENPEDFRNQGLGTVSLVDRFRRALDDYDKNVRMAHTEEFLRKYCKDDISPHHDDEKKLDSAVLRNDAAGDAFWYVRKLYERTNLPAFWLCFCLYLIGSLLLCFVVGDNSVSVLKSFWESVSGQ